MIIKIKFDDCVHLSEMSHYNSNYYRLPFTINGNNVIFEHYTGSEEFDGFQLGYIENNKFVCVSYLNTTETEYITIDSELIGKNDLL